MRRRPRPHDPGGASPDPGRGRPPPLVAPGRHGARRRLGALLGRSVRSSSPARRSRPRAPPAWPSTRYVRCRRASEDNAIFADEIGHDRFRNTPGDQLLTGLRGKDVILAFVESYGRVAVQDSSLSPRRRCGSRQGNEATAGRRLLLPERLPHLVDVRRRQLAGALHHAFGALGRQPAALLPARRDRPLHTQQAFKRAGWRTVDDVPSNNRDWPQGSSFYRYDKVYDRRNVGYRGPRFAYASMPDQYVLAALQRLELAKPTAVPSSRRSTWCRATRRGPASPG